jgi:hypothetical protein
MGRIRVAGVCLAVMFAALAGGAASASAAPEFLHAGGPLGLTFFTGKSVGAVVLSDTITGAVVKCSKEELEGEIEFGGTKHVEEVVLKFKGCFEVFKKTVKCTVKSTGQPNGSLRTKRLDGDLSFVPVAEAASERGLDLKPEVGKVLMTIEAPGCKQPPAPIEGSVIGEVTPKGPPETFEKKLISTTTAGKQTIRNFPGQPVDVLETFATEVTLTSSVTLKFLETVEVA